MTPAAVTLPPRLTRIVDWSQALLGQVLAPGDLAVDLTAGTGRDTLFLWRRVAPTGRVLTFDIQSEALQSACALLSGAGAPVHPVAAASSGMTAPGIYPLAACHGRLAEFLPGSPRGVIANLGYLPGGDPTLTTRSGTTLRALEATREALGSGGRLGVAVYRGHPGAGEEAQAVMNWFHRLPAADWSVLQLAVSNRPEAPFLLTAERRG